MPMSSPKPVLIVDGSRFEGFTQEFSRHLSAYTWRGSLYAFNDVLRGGFGTPDGGFVLRWMHSNRSRAALGYEATSKRLESLLNSCHPPNRHSLARRLNDARRERGPTLFDEIVEIIVRHGPGGDEAEDGVELELA